VLNGSPAMTSSGGETTQCILTPTMRNVIAQFDYKNLCEEKKI